MLQTLLVVVLVVAAGYVLLVLLAWRFQERVVFQPPRPPADVPAATRLEATAPDGTPLFALVAGDPASAPLTVLAFHGNADLAVWVFEWAEEVHRRTEAAVVVAEYRGYGGVPGAPTYEAVRRDARVLRDALVARWPAAADRLTYYGHSLGSAVATELASEVAPRALVLESPFTSARAMAARVGAPGVALVWPFIARVHFDTELRVRLLDVPVSVAHGTRDIVIPVRMGRQVHAAARRKGELLVVSGAGHNDVAFTGGEAYWEWLARAIRGAALRD